MNKVLIINRQCAFSTVSVNKARPPWFSREKCLESILKEIEGNSKVEFRVVYDNARGSLGDHFVGKRVDKGLIHEITAGQEAPAFIGCLDYIKSLKPEPNDIIYIVEDDILHRPGWLTALAEGIEKGDGIDHGAYVSLVDLGDKYTEMYSGLYSEIFATKSCHWRITPSTTNTYAFRYKTFKLTEEVHRYYSTNVPFNISQDHQKFVTLGKMGQPVITPIPSWAAHVETATLPPVIDWRPVEYIEETV